MILVKMPEVAVTYRYEQRLLLIDERFQFFQDLSGLPGV